MTAELVKRFRECIETGSETTPPYAPQNSRFGSEPPSVEYDVDVCRYEIVSCMPETTTIETVGEHFEYLFKNCL